MDKNYVVTKSNYFIMNSSYDLSLEEQKIILTLASMVQPTDEQFKPYIFKIADFIELLGIETQTKYTEIPKITKELMKKVFEIHEGKKLIQTAWLSGAVYEKGTGYVELIFSPYLKPYMLELKEKFTQYQLANILSMKSKYSPRVYEILKCNEFKKQGYIEIDIDELRKLLRCEEIYPLYADFKRFVLIRTQKELRKLTDIDFDFEEIKTIRKVTALKFYIKQNNAKKAIDEVAIASKEIEIDPLQEFDLIKQVQAIFKEDITRLQAKELVDTAKGNINIIKGKYEISKITSDIKNIVGWMLKAIKNDYQAPKRKGKFDSFNDYPQRTYDYDDLEKKLLGWNNRTDEAIEEDSQQLSMNSE